MITVNDLPVYQESDMCALDKYSEEMAKKVHEKIEDAKYDDAEITEDVEQLKEDNKKNEKDIETLQAEYEKLQKDFDSYTVKSTVSGESINVTDSSDLNCDLKLSGNDVQEVTEQSANILDLTKLSDSTTSQCTVDEKKANELTLTSTANATSTFLRTKIKLKAGTWYFKREYEKLSDTDLNSTGQVNAQKASDWSMVFSLQKTSNVVTFTLNEDTEIYLTFILKSSQDNSTDIIKARFYNLMFSTENIDYTPFVPQKPSFEYPSEVETVGSNVNLFDKESISENKAINGYYLNPSYGQLVDSSLSNTTDYMTIQKDKSYIFHFDYDTLGSSNNRAYCFYNEQKEVISSTKDTLYNLSNKELKFTATQNGFIRITYDKNCKDIKFEKGIKATPYSPYNQGSVEIDVVNKNWLKLEDIEETTSKGITYSCKKGILKIKGTSTAGIQIDLANNIHLKPNIYTHSVNTIIKGLYLSFDNTHDTMLSQQNGITTTFNIDIEKTYSKYFLWIDPNTTVDLELKPQLEIGEQATSYVEHQSQTKIMPIQQEMLEGDYLDFENEKEIHSWEKKILNGTEGFSVGTAPNQVKTTYFKMSYINDVLSSNAINCKCENLKAFTGNNLWNQDAEGIAQSKSQLVIRLSKEVASTEEELNQYLAENNITVYCKKTETELAFTETQKQEALEIKKARTYKNVTNVMSTDEVSPIYELTYKKDLETLFNQLNQGG